MTPRKIVLIGAGSRCFGAGQIRDILVAKELMGLQFTLTLVDEDAKALDLMVRLAHRIKEHTGTDIAIEHTTDRRQALKGADYVLVAVARKRWPLWEQDFRVPLSYGFNHCLGENGGPGAIFHALRSFELIIPICRDIEELCPNALMLNFTNPEARVLHAICHLTKVKAIGLCHGVFSVLELIKRYMNRPLEEFDIVSAGMNHFYCVLKLVDKKDGRDLLPEVLERAKNDPELPPLFRKMVGIFDMLTYVSDDHIGEYLSFGSEFSGSKWHYGQESQKVLRDTPPAATSDVELFATGQKELTEEFLCPSGELAVSIIGDIELKQNNFKPAVNVLNTEGYIENLPTTAVVEVPARVDASGVHPLHVGSISEPVAAYMRTHFAIHDLLTEAYRTRSRRLLLQALLLDPNVNSICRAEKMLDEMLEMQSDFLPTFA
jgi:alpha-galactosidase